MSEEILLRLDHFQVAFGAQKVLTDVTLSLPRRGLTVLLGPAGTGKSTLLRTLAGLNQAQPSLLTGGEARFEGAPLRDGHARIAYVMQKARFFMESVRENMTSALPGRQSLDRAAQLELVTALLVSNGLGALASLLELEVATLSPGLQRRLAIARAVASEPALLMVDEPTAGLEADEAAPLLDLLRQHASERSVLVVTHNQAHARLLGGTSALLAEGKIQEVSPTQAFFAAPWTAAGRIFVSTGGYSSPPPEEDEARPPSRPTSALASARPTTASPPVPSFYGPRGFYWVHEGQLGGLPRPGIVASLEQDLSGLQRLGVTSLVTLEETPTVPAEALAAHGVRSIHFPIVDMSVPDLEAALNLCASVEGRLQAGEVVAFHCRAGMGRTGTLLACQLIFEGVSAVIALETVRQINPRAIQSEEQAAFLGRFERARQAFARASPSSPITTAPEPGRNPQS